MAGLLALAQAELLQQRLILMQLFLLGKVGADQVFELLFERCIVAIVALMIGQLLRHHLALLTDLIDLLFKLLLLLLCLLMDGVLSRCGIELLGQHGQRMLI